MSPYASLGTFISRVLDGGSTVNWEIASWTTDAPAGTNLAMSVRCGNTPTPDGTWTSFTPIANGASIGFSARYLQYSAALNTTDVGQTPALQDVTIQYMPVTNQAPLAVGDSYITDEDVPPSVSAPGVLANDTDGDADPLTAHLVNDAAHGNLTLNPDGSFSYTPDPGYFGPDSFTYKANDGAADSNEATVSITITESTPPPILPASFYGAAHFNDHAPTAGDLVLASLPGVAFSTPLVVQPDLSLTYAIDLPGDLPDTPEIEGGVEGSPITFSINGRVVAASFWHSGTNSRLDFHPPTAALALAAPPVLEGTPFQLTAGASSDAFDDIASFAFDCDGDSTFEIGPQAGSSATCPALDDGPHTVGVSLLDAQGGSGSTTLNFTAADVAPTAMPTQAALTPASPVSRSLSAAPSPARPPTPAPPPGIWMATASSARPARPASPLPSPGTSPTTTSSPCGSAMMTATPSSATLPFTSPTPPTPSFCSRAGTSSPSPHPSQRHPHPGPRQPGLQL